MPGASRITAWLDRRTVFQQTTLVVAAALVATELLVLVFYWIFFADRLLLDLVLSGIIVILVGYPLGFFTVSQNMRLRRLSLELQRMARTDNLTGLVNRGTFFTEAETAMATVDEGRGAFLYIDVDHFKTLNDTHGHAAGDAVLRALGDAIRFSVRETDICARLGGEEFGVFLPRADRSIATEVAQRIRRRAARIGDELGLGPAKVTVSIGLELRQAQDDLDALMARADAKLYAAKAAGRNRVVGGTLAA